MTLANNIGTIPLVENAEHKAGSAHLGLWSLAVGLAAYLIGYAAFAIIASQSCEGKSLMVVLVFAECAVLACVTVLAAARLDPRRFGARRFTAAMAAVCGGAALASAVVLVGAAAMGAEPLAGGLLAQVVVFSFCLLLAAIFAFVRCIGAEQMAAQLVSLLVACALVGTVFYANSLVETEMPAESRSRVINAVLAPNPIMAITWSLLRFDLLHRQVMYDRISVIGRFYAYEHPQWWAVSCVYVMCAALLLLGAAWFRQRVLTNQGGFGQ